MINTFDLDVVNLFLKTCKSEINKKNVILSDIEI